MNPGVAASKDTHHRAHYRRADQSQNPSPYPMTRGVRQDDSHHNEENDYIGLDPRHGKSLDRSQRRSGGHSRTAQAMYVSPLGIPSAMNP